MQQYLLSTFIKANRGKWAASRREDGALEPARAVWNGLPTGNCLESDPSLKQHIRALLVHTQRVFAEACCREFQPLYFVTPPRMKLCPSPFMFHAGYCVWQVLVWRESVQLAQNKTETSPDFQSWVARWRQDRKHPSPLSCQSGLAISTNDGVLSPWWRTHTVGRTRPPDILSQISSSQWQSHLQPHASRRWVFISSILYWISEHPCVRGWTQRGEPCLAKGLWRRCQFRMEDSHFQGLAISSGISLARTYSQQHSGSKWKGTSGCGGSEWRNTHHFKTCRPGAPPKSQGCSECGKQNDT